MNKFFNKVYNIGSNIYSIIYNILINISFNLFKLIGLLFSFMLIGFLQSDESFVDFLSTIKEVCITLGMFNLFLFFCFIIIFIFFSIKKK